MVHQTVFNLQYSFQKPPPAVSVLCSVKRERWSERAVTVPFIHALLSSDLCWTGWPFPGGTWSGQGRGHLFPLDQKVISGRGLAKGCLTLLCSCVATICSSHAVYHPSPELWYNIFVVNTLILLSCFCDLQNFQVCPYI